MSFMEPPRPGLFTTRHGWRAGRGLLSLMGGLAALGLGAEDLKTGNNAAAQPRTPAEEQRSFTLPKGFAIELVASEETGLPKPVSVSFDTAGRMWSMTAVEYPRDNEPDIWTHPGRDKIVVFDHPLGPGPHRPRVFADGMVMPLGLLPYQNGALVAQGPEILRLEDTDGDGRADKRSVLIHGFGVQDTHTLPHQLEFAPGNWIAFSQGVLNNGTAVTASGKEVNFDKTVIAEFRADGSDLRVIGAGLNNIWSWVQDRGGRVFFHEANDLGYSLVPFEEDTTYPSFINRLVHPDSPYHPPTAPNLSLGGTGFSGLALADDREGGFPAPWRGVFFVANPITRRINAVAAVLGANGVHQFEQKPDLVATDDEFFRPVALRFGPDGCLYIVDWYNRIISHNEVDRNHPARDKTRGRVWRVRHTTQTARSAPNVAAAETAALIPHLRAPGVWEMRAAWREIVDRHAVELLPELIQIAQSPVTPDDTRIVALWSVEGLNHFDAGLWRVLLTNGNADVRHEAVRALSSVKPPLDAAFNLLGPLANEPTFRVRYQVIRYFRDCPEPIPPEISNWLARWRTKPDLTKTVKGWERDYLAPGGVYESAFQNLLLQMVAEKGVARTAPVSSSKWMTVLRTHSKKAEAEQRKLSERIGRLTRFVDTAASVEPARAEPFFKATCGQCHPVGADGKGFGPPLAGSKNRTTEGILTAVLDPSAAVESVFRMYHVETKAGDAYDGFFGGESDGAITVRFAGGAQQVIRVADIREAGYIEGMSVMPEGLLDAMSDAQIAELVRYVQSLK
jgi:putative membrane-bound dehydrogenase-like protein